MIHFTCDCCGRPIHPDKETRYVARIEVYAAVDDDGESVATEADHLQEIEDLLERVDDGEADGVDELLYKQVSYDLCEECRERFLRDPLGRGAGQRIGFSKN